MVSDRIIGVLCLGVAVGAGMWGNGTSGRIDVQAGGRPTAAVDGAGGEPAGAGLEPSTTTTTAAVGGGPAAPGSSTTTTAAQASSTTTTTIAPASLQADAALAQKALLAPADLPAGFTQSRPAPAPGGAEGPFERCLGNDAAVLTAAVRAKAASAEYVRSGTTGTVSTTAAVLDQPASAERVMSILGSDPARSCFEGLINMRLARNPNLSDDVRGKISPLDAGLYADQTTAFRFEVRLPAEDVEADPPEGEKEIPFVADFVFLRRGRIIVLFEFGSLRHPFPPADLKVLATNVAAHV